MAGAGGDNLNGRKSVRRTHDYLLARAINCDDGDRAAKIIQEALGTESNEPTPASRRRGRLIASSAPPFIGDWLQTGVRILA
jgi:hypothetical protein